MKAVLEMEMPLSCTECPLTVHEEFFKRRCVYTGRVFAIDGMHSKAVAYDCPLKPVEAKEVENYPEEKENRDVM